MEGNVADLLTVKYSDRDLLESQKRRVDALYLLYFLSFDDRSHFTRNHHHQEFQSQTYRQFPFAR